MAKQKRNKQTTKGTKRKTAVTAARPKSLDQRENIFLVTGIGGSAGGLEAMRLFFRKVPEHTGIAYIVALHLAPDRKSMLSSILAQAAKMPVVDIRQGELIVPDHVYVVPAGMLATIERQRFRLRDAGKIPRHTIDALFQSLGEELGSRAAAVVLSGLGDDGSLGVKAVREHGGLTIAQGSDSTAPQHPEMPRSATATGAVDFVLSVEDIPKALMEHARHLAKLQKNRKPAAEKAEDLYQKLFDMLNARIGHDFKNYKRSTFARRVQRRMQVVRVGSLNEYVSHCRNDPTEIDRLFDDLLIGVTQFFRDRPAFEVLAKTVIPRLFEGKGKDDAVRIWVPGCSTGEEVYSLAILVREHLEKFARAIKVQIFATDIDERSMEIARTGRYGKQIATDITPERLKRFFYAEGANYRLVKEVREMCIFSAHSLIKNPPYSRLDMISCRNLLIYFDSHLQDRLVPLFHYALRPGGYLFLGPSENLSRHTDMFSMVDKKHRILQRREIGRRVLPDLPAIPSVPSEARMLGLGARDGALGISANRRGQTIDAAERLLLERYMPAFVITDDSLNIVHYSARTGKFLESPAGAPERNLLALARRGLRFDLRAVVDKALKSERPVIKSDAHLESENGMIGVRLIAQPLGKFGADPNLTMIIFHELGPLEVSRTHRKRDRSEKTIEQLETELRLARDSLQHTIEEYETSNEELKSSNEELLSVNEELQSSNEELETSKEELQSLNEELQTVNQETVARVDELDRANTDLKNLIESTQIATLFLDRNLLILNFTPMITKIFRLIRTDIGRPIQDIAHSLGHSTLEKDMREVLRTDKPIEREIKPAESEAIFSMRILPYRDVEGHTQGIVLTFVDITSAKASEHQRGLLVEELNHRVKNILSVAMSIANQMLGDSKSEEKFRAAYFGRLQALAKANELLAQRKWAGAELRDVIELELNPYQDDKKVPITLTGPDLILKPRAAISLGLVFHELATNAVKHGALAKPGMGLGIRWELDGADRDELVIKWEETNGHGIKAPQTTSFGMNLIRRAITKELSASLDVKFREGGFQCIMRIPTSGILAG